MRAMCCTWLGAMTCEGGRGGLGNIYSLLLNTSNSHILRDGYQILLLYIISIHREESNYANFVIVYSLPKV